jgi:hypothetical protein
MMQSVLARNGNRDPLTGAMQTNIQNRLSGKPAPYLKDKFAEMDQATATGAAQARMDATQPGMFGQGRASRGGQMVQQANMQRISDDKIKQAQLMGADTQSAMSDATALRGLQNADRDFTYRAASDLGDTTTMGGLARMGLSDQGIDYTGYGENAMRQQAATASANAAESKAQQKDLYDLQRKQLDRSLQSGADSSNGRWWQKVGTFASMLVG